MKKHTFLFLLLPLLSYAGDSQELTLSKAIEIYWNCDYLTTTQMLDSSDAANCSLSYEKILKEKFKGNFNDFIVWWKENKKSEHAKIKKIVDANK